MPPRPTSPSAKVLDATRLPDQPRLSRKVGTRALQPSRAPGTGGKPEDHRTSQSLEELRYAPALESWQQSAKTKTPGSIT